MKKTSYLFVSLILLMNYSKAQKSSLGFTAGTTFASYKAKNESISVTSKTKVGFTAGVISFIALDRHFSFMPALNFTQKGGKLKEQSFTDKATFNYLELPLNFVYNTKSAKGKFFIGAGPSFAFGLSGKDKWEDGTEKGSDDIKFGSGDEDDFKAFDAGINFLAGYRFAGGFLIAANYNAGLNNLVNTIDGDNSKMHNRYFGFRIGYMFSTGKKK